MVVRITAQVKINTVPKDVFTYLVEPKYHTLWNPQLQAIAPLTRLKKDTVYKTTNLLLGVEVTGKNEVTKCTENRELEISNDTGLLKYRVRYTLETESDRTLLRCHTNVEVDNRAFVFTKPVLKLLGQRELKSDLQALKIAVEQQLVPL